MPKIRILVADDHPLMRAGIAASIDGEEDMQVVAAAQNGVEALEFFRIHTPDVCLVDLRMPLMGGMDFIKAVRSKDPEAKIVVLTASSGDAHVERALRAGASSFLLKHMLREHLTSTIRAVHQGEHVLPEEIAHLLASNRVSDTLSARELDVLSRVAQGMSNREIAVALSISEFTVKAHVKAIMTKLSANDRTHAVMLATQRGFLDLEN